MDAPFVKGNNNFWKKYSMFSQWQGKQRQENYCSTRVAGGRSEGISSVAF